MASINGLISLAPKAQLRPMLQNGEEGTSLETGVKTNTATRKGKNQRGTWAQTDIAA